MKNKLKAYMNGAVFGMMCEYLFRTSHGPLAITLTVVVGVGILADITSDLIDLLKKD